MSELLLLRKSPDGFYAYQPVPVAAGRNGGSAAILENGLLMGTGSVLAQRTFSGAALGAPDLSDILAWSLS